MRKRTLKFTVVLASLCLMAVFYTAAVQAHPIEYHMQPLDTETIERVIQSLDGMIGELGKTGSLELVQLPEGAMGVSVLPWAVQDALMEADEVTTIDSPSLKRALISAGYGDSPYVVEEWQVEAEQVFETYEVLKKGLNLEQVYAGYAALEKDRQGLTEDQAVQRESALVRNHKLLQTTVKDLDLVRQYLQQLEALADSLGVDHGN